MNSSTKKTIAREGLIIIGFIIVGLTIKWAAGLSLPNPKLEPQAYKLSSFSNYELYKMAKMRGMACNPPDASTYFTCYNINRVLHFVVAPFIIIFGYPVSLFIRFVIWAIRTLRR